MSDTPPSPEVQREAILRAARALKQKLLDMWARIRKWFHEQLLPAVRRALPHLQALHRACVRARWQEHHRQRRLAERTLPTWPVTDGTTLGEIRG